MADLHEEKADLRASMRALRDGMRPGERERFGEAVVERLFALKPVAAAGTVLAFASFGSEIPTAGIIKRLHGAGRSVLLPSLDGGELLAARFEAGDELVMGAFGIEEPRNRVVVPPEEIDLVLVPGLAFDRQGNRVGYGGGHFDRCLKRLPAAATRIGLAYGFQLVEGVPHGPDDEPVDMIVTDRATIICRPERVGT